MKFPSKSHVQNTFLGIAPLVWQLLFLWVPVVGLFGVSLLSMRPEGWVFNISKFGQFWHLRYAIILLRSVLLSLGTAVACAVFSYPLVYWVVFCVRKWSEAVMFLIVLPFWTNLLVLIYGWFYILERQGLINLALQKIGFISEPLLLLYRPLATYIVMVYCYMPFMILPLYTSLEKIDTRLIEASKDLGATRWQTFMRVIFPLSLGGIRIGLYLVLIPSFGEFVIPALVGGSRNFFAGSLISHLFLVTRDIYAGAAFTVIAGIILVIMCALVEIAFRFITSRVRGYYG